MKYTSLTFNRKTNYKYKFLLTNNNNTGMKEHRLIDSDCVRNHAPLEGYACQKDFRFHYPTPVLLAMAFLYILEIALPDMHEET